MLVLTRIPGQTLLLVDGVTIHVTVVSCNAGRVRIGINAPPEIVVERPDDRLRATRAREPEND